MPFTNFLFSSMPMPSGTSRYVTGIKILHKPSYGVEGYRDKQLGHCEPDTVVAVCNEPNFSFKPTHLFLPRSASLGTIQDARFVAAVRDACRFRVRCGTIPSIRSITVSCAR